MSSPRDRFDSPLSPLAALHESVLRAPRCSAVMATSSLIRRALYRPDRRELDLLLAGGRRYVYSNVPEAVAASFQQAPSKGQFYNASIRNCFPCREIGPAPRRRYG